jgi:hypothetical protein
MQEFYFVLIFPVEEFWKQLRRPFPGNLEQILKFQNMERERERTQAPFPILSTINESEGDSESE